MVVLGIDCATRDTKVGLALARYDSGRMRLREVVLGSSQGSVSSTIVEWLHSVESSALLAIDAPLGWPEALSRSLTDHQAGDGFTVCANNMFRRGTDRFIQEQLSKTPLDVGADRIARTAHSALCLLGDLRRKLRIPLPLTWQPEFAGVAAIEVYPAATLVAHGFRSTGYKKREQGPARRAIVQLLGGELDIGEHGALLESSGDALDAAVCLLAAKDFLEAVATAPANLALAKREGWIWAAPRLSAPSLEHLAGPASAVHHGTV